MLVKRGCLLTVGALLIAGLSGCSSSVKMPTYRYVGIDLGASVEGLLVKERDCILVNSPTARFVPIWPVGTSVEVDGVRLPEGNGGGCFGLGEPSR